MKLQGLETQHLTAECVFTNSLVGGGEIRFQKAKCSCISVVNTEIIIAGLGISDREFRCM